MAISKNPPSEAALIEVLRYIKQRDAEGVGVTATDLSRGIGCDDETARGRLKHLESRQMVDCVIVKNHNIYRLPGRDWTTYKIGEEVIPRPRRWDRLAGDALTPERMDLFKESVKPGDAVEYLLHYEQDEEHGKKTAIIEKTTVKEKGINLVRLANGHSVTWIDIWQWNHLKLPIGATLGENYKKQYYTRKGCASWK